MESDTNAVIAMLQSMTGTKWIIIGVAFVMANAVFDFLPRLGSAASLGA